MCEMFGGHHVSSMKCVVVATTMARCLLSVHCSVQSTGVTPLSVGCIMGDLPTVQNLVQAMTLKLFRSETSWGKLHKPVSERIWEMSMWVVCYGLLIQRLNRCFG